MKVMQSWWYSSWISCRNHKIGYLPEWLACNRIVTELCQWSPQQRIPHPSVLPEPWSRAWFLFFSLLPTSSQFSGSPYLLLRCSSSPLLYHPRHFSVNTAGGLWPPRSAHISSYKPWAAPTALHCFHKVPPDNFRVAVSEGCPQPNDVVWKPVDAAINTYPIWLQFVIWVYVPHKVGSLSKILSPSETSGLANLGTGNRSTMKSIPASKSYLRW